MDKKLKICMVSGDFPPIKGGISDYTKMLFNGVGKSLGKDNVFLITSKDALRENKNIINKIKKWNLISIIRIFSLIKKINPGIVHIQYPASRYAFNPAINLLPLLMKIGRCHIYIVSTLHEFSNRSLLGKLRLSFNIIFSDKILVVSEKYIKNIIDFLWPLKNFLKKKIIYIPIGPNIVPSQITPEEIKKTREGITKSSQDKILCYFGSIRAEKGIELLINAFEELISELIPQKIKLIFIGQCNGEYCLKIKNLVRKRELSQNITFTGHLPSRNISKYIFASDICVLPFPDGVSTKRGSFLVPLFHNIPIITTKSNLTPLELLNRKNIILIEPNNKDSLKKEIRNLIVNQKQQNIIEQTSLFLKEYFSWENIIKKIISNYYKSL